VSVAIRPQLAPSAEWLSIHEASELVGVSVATLRRWCDAGEVRAFTTPGGHRRFERSAVLGLARPPAGRQPVGCNGETQIRVVRAYRRELRLVDAELGALSHASERVRRQLRLHGAQMVGALLEALDAPPAEVAGHIDQARFAAASCGSLAAREGLSLADALALFVRFRRPFVHQVGAVVRGQGRDAGDATAVLVAASDALDQLLPAVVAGYRAGSASDPG
jgi:excisionase family DNA binding protein